MNLQEWKKRCRKTWESEYDYLPMGKFAKIERVDTLLEIATKLLLKNAPLKQHLFDFMTVKCCNQLKTEKNYKSYTIYCH